MSSQEPQPAWLDAGNDTPPLDDDETTPLFGTGPLPQDDQLQDEEAPASYGGVDETEEKEPAKEDAEKWHEDTKPAPKKKKKPDVAAKSKSFQEFLNQPPKPCCLHIFHFIEAVAIIGCFCLMATQVLPLFLVPVKSIGVLQIALRTYISLFCFTFILVEWNAPLPFLKDSRILQNYFSRGFLYSFIGLIGMEEAFGVMVEDKLAHGSSEFSVSWASLFMQLSSWLIVGIGCIYCVLGIFCLQSLRTKMSQDYQERLEAYRNLKTP